MGKKWYQTARRWIQINITEDACQDRHLDEWREHWRSGLYDGAIINCGSFIRYYQSQYDYQMPAKGLGEQDVFGDYVKALQEDGLAVVGRMDLEYIDVAYE